MGRREAATQTKHSKAPEALEPFLCCYQATSTSSPCYQTHAAYYSWIIHVRGEFDDANCSAEYPSVVFDESKSCSWLERKQLGHPSSLLSITVIDLTSLRTF